MVVLTIFTRKYMIRGLLPTNVYIQTSKQMHFPKIFTLLKERGILNILNKPNGICVALCIPCDEIWLESNVAKESCSWMLSIHFFLFLMKNQLNMHVTFESHSSHSFHLINDIHDQAFRSINEHGNKQF